jgi:hypothetical protein
LAFLIPRPPSLSLVSNTFFLSDSALGTVMGYVNQLAGQFLWGFGFSEFAVAAMPVERGAGQIEGSLGIKLVSDANSPQAKTLLKQPEGDGDQVFEVR